MKHVHLFILVVLPLLACGGQSEEPADVALAKRAYSKAQDMVRDRMKIPKSTSFPAWPDSLQRDTTEEGGFIIGGDSAAVFLKAELVMVSGRYESQNSFGAMLPGHFTVYLETKDSGKTFAPAFTDMSKSVKLEKH